MNYTVPAVITIPESGLGIIPGDWLTDNLFASNDVIRRYTSSCAIEIYRTLNLGDTLGEFQDVKTLIKHHGFVDKFRYALLWILRTLQERGLLTNQSSGSVSQFKQVKSLPQSDCEEIKKLAIEINENNLSMVNLIDTATSAYPDVASGKIKGEEALFGLAELQLWLDYFHNDNPLYAINNKITARIAHDVVNSRKKVKILEFGAGAGSAAEALLDEFSRTNTLDNIESYWVTEPNAFFNRKGGRLLKSKYPDVPIKALSLDINIPWQPQLGDQSFDLIYSVNTLHVAKNIGFALEQAKRHLSGWLVAGECIRPFPQQPLFTEMIFQVLDSFLDVDLDEELRPHPGFLTPEQWQGWLQKHGYTDVSVKPDIVAIREVYTSFLAGAICGYHP